MDPAQGGEGKSLYVGNLAKSVTQVLLYEVFGALGQVTSVKLITDKISGDSQGYGFVDYIDHETAEMAMNPLNGRDLYGNELRINWAAAALNKEDTSTHHHIFVGDLAPEVDDGSLWEAFQSFGSISEARVVRDPSGGNRSKGYGFVAFREHADAQNAMRQMTGACIGSRVIRCNWASQKSGGSKTSTNKTADYEHVLHQVPQTNTTIYIGNLPSEAQEQQLRDIFEEFGKIVECRIQNDKGYAFIKFQDHQSAADAIVNGTGKIIGMRTIKCSWGKEKNDSGSQQQQNNYSNYSYPTSMNMGYPQMGGGMYPYPVPSYPSYPQSQQMYPPQQQYNNRK